MLIKQDTWYIDVLGLSYILLKDRVKLGKLGQVFKKTHVGQSWKKAKIHKNIANVASGLGKILEKKGWKKYFGGGVGARAAKKISVPTYPTK